MFLANENFPQPSIVILRNLGYTVKSIQSEYPGINDAQVMELAKELDLIILIFDSDYGELIFKYAKTNPPAVIYFREKGNNPESAAIILKSLLQNPTLNFKNTFTVVESEVIRQREY